MWIYRSSRDSLFCSIVNGRTSKRAVEIPGELRIQSRERAFEFQMTFSGDEVETSRSSRLFLFRGGGGRSSFVESALRTPSQTSEGDGGGKAGGQFDSPPPPPRPSFAPEGAEPRSSKLRVLFGRPRGGGRLRPRWLKGAAPPPQRRPEVPPPIPHPRGRSPAVGPLSQEREFRTRV